MESSLLVFPCASMPRNFAAGSKIKPNGRPSKENTSHAREAAS